MRDKPPVYYITIISDLSDLLSISFFQDGESGIVTQGECHLVESGTDTMYSGSAGE